MPASLDCPQIESWQALFSGTLDPDEQRRCERHLESCPACQARLDRAEECGDPLLSLGRQVGDPTVAPANPTLVHVLEKLHEVKSPLRAISHEPADLFFLNPTDRPDLLGTLGDYEVSQVIGEGGMGVVLKAYEPALHRLVAIKVMAAAIAGNATARQRFTREAKAAAAVCHDHVVTVHGVSEEAGLPYLVMQYVAGESLQARLDRSGPLAIEQIVRIGMQTAQGLAAAHAQGLIHRDIKPANLLLSFSRDAESSERSASRLAKGALRSEDSPSRLNECKVKITDFGLARMVDDVGLTQSGVVAGTPEYMAPEQARGEAVDHRADLFSLGSVLYALCVGAPPFRGSTAIAVLRQVCEQEPLPIRSLNPGVPPWLEALIARLMTKDPADRLQSAAEVAELLEGYLAHLRQPLSVPAPLLPRVPTDGECDPSVPDRQPSLLRLIPLACGLASLIILTWLGVSFQAAGKQKDDNPRLTQEYLVSLKGDFASNPGLELAGPSAEGCVRIEPEGLRITLPRGWNEIRDNTGANLPIVLMGDFEITVIFEILKEPTASVAGPQQTRITMGTGLQTESLTVATISRRVQAKGDKQFLVYMIYPNNATGKSQQRGKGFATKADSGRLRLSRTGSVLSFWIAEGSDKDFTLLQQYPFGTEDVNHVHLAGSTGNARCSLDVRLTDLRIRAESMPSAPSGTIAVSGTNGASGGRSWLIAAGIVGLILTLSLSVVAWFVPRQKRRRGNDDARVPVNSDLPRPEAISLVFAFACPECGRNLKARAELAGKKVKCPQCGKAVQVSEAIE